MAIKVEVSQAPNGRYFFKTEEKRVFCPECKKKYKHRKICLYCLKEGKKIETKPTISTQEGWISEDLKKYSCTCIFSSWHMWAQHWRKNYPNSRCKHCKFVMKHIKFNR